MRVILVAAIAANILPNTTHAKGGAANGTLPGNGAATGDVFAQLLAALSAGTPGATASPQAAPSGASTSAANNFKAKLSSGTADAQAQSTSGDASRLAALDATLSTGSAPAGKPAAGQKSGSNNDAIANATTGKDAAPSTDSSNLQVPLIIAPNGTLPTATTPAPKPQQAALDALQSAAANTNTPATGQTQADALATAQMTDQAASGIIPNGATAKPPRDAKADVNAAAADSVKTQSQTSTAGALAALSNAATHNFTDQQTSTVHALPVHALGGQKDSNGSANTGSDNQQNNAHPQTATMMATSDSRTAAADAAPAPAAAAPQQSAPVTAAAPTDGASIAATNGAAQNGPPPSTNQMPVGLQFAPASPNAVLDTNALAVTIATKSKDGSKQFDIRLDPAELGRVDVRLTVDEAGKTQATLSVEKPQTLELLQKDSSHLETALKDAGLDLSQNGLNFSLKGQQQQGGNGNAPFSRGRTLNVTAVAAVDSTPSTTSLSGVSASDTRLDIRV